MGRVYDSYLATPERDKSSLIEFSRRRWTTGASLVYDKGMLAAFLCDLELRRAGGNRRSLDDVYRELFRRHPPGARRMDGNEAIISALNDALGSSEFAEHFIKGRGEIELAIELAPYGLRVENAGGRNRLSVGVGLGQQQREMLRSLGYKHGW